MYAISRKLMFFFSLKVAHGFFFIFDNITVIRGDTAQPCTTITFLEGVICVYSTRSAYILCFLVFNFIKSYATGHGRKTYPLKKSRKISTSCLSLSKY